MELDLVCMGNATLAQLYVLPKSVAEKEWKLKDLKILRISTKSFRICHFKLFHCAWIFIKV